MNDLLPHSKQKPPAFTMGPGREQRGQAGQGYDSLAVHVHFPFVCFADTTPEQRQQIKTKLAETEKRVQAMAAAPRPALPLPPTGLSRSDVAQRFPVGSAGAAEPPRVTPGQTTTTHAALRSWLDGSGRLIHPEQVNIKDFFSGYFTSSNPAALRKADKLAHSYGLNASNMGHLEEYVRSQLPNLKFKVVSGGARHNSLMATLYGYAGPAPRAEPGPAKELRIFVRPNVMEPDRLKVVGCSVANASNRAWHPAEYIQTFNGANPHRR